MVNPLAKVPHVETRGKHPETIESTVGVFRKSAQKEILPLKAEIEKRTKQIKALQEREDRLAKLAADAEAGEFGAKLLGEGREVAETRKRIEQERAGLQAQVSMKEVGLVDAESVAQQLLAFHSVMGALPAEEQKEMVRFLLKEIRVYRFDPAKDQGELGEGEIPLKIRTQWFVLNITFFSNDLFTRALRDGVKEVRNFDKMAARAGIEPVVRFLEACVTAISSETAKTADAQLRAQELSSLTKIIAVWPKLAGEFRTAMRALTRSVQQ